MDVLAIAEQIVPGLADGSFLKAADGLGPGCDPDTGVCGAGSHGHERIGAWITGGDGVLDGLGYGSVWDINVTFSGGAPEVVLGIAFECPAIKRLAGEFLE